MLVSIVIVSGFAANEPVYCEITSSPVPISVALCVNTHLLFSVSTPVSLSTWLLLLLYFLLLVHLLVLLQYLLFLVLYILYFFVLWLAILLPICYSCIYCISCSFYPLTVAILILFHY